MAERDGTLVAPGGRAPALFLVAAGLLAVFAASTGVRTFTGAAYPEVHDVFGPAGFFVGLVGLVGLYPALVDRTPLARFAAVVAAVPLVGWLVIAGIGIGEAAGVLPDATVVLPGAVFVVVFLTTILAYLLFGVASIRADVHSRTVGIILLGPAIVILVLIAGAGVLSTVAWGEFVLDTAHVVAHLAIGLALRSERGPTDRAGPAPESTP